jgi:hypothetical protein
LNTQSKTPAVVTARGRNSPKLCTHNECDLLPLRQAYHLAVEAYRADPPDDPNTRLEQLGRIADMRRAVWGKARR